MCQSGRTSHLRELAKLLTLLIGLVVALAPVAASAASFKEVGVDRWGADYRHFTLSATNGAGACARACEADKRCRAWTFVRPGVVGPQALCRLKSAVPHAKDDACCISGIAAGASADVLAGYPSANPNTTLAEAKPAPAGITAAIRPRPANLGHGGGQTLSLDASPIDSSALTATGAPIDHTAPPVPRRLILP